jgi:hypothetical protein
LIDNGEGEMGEAAPAWVEVLKVRDAKIDGEGLALVVVAAGVHKEAPGL